MNITFTHTLNTDDTCPMLILEVLGVVTTNPDWDDCEIAEYLSKPAWDVSQALHRLAAMGLVQPVPRKERP